MRLLNYVQSGKGRGIRFVFLMTLVLAIIYGGIIYFAGVQYTKLPEVQKFLKSIPTFSIENGEIQDKTIRWRAQIPGSPAFLTIDTTQEELTPPIADGAYVTSKYSYSVSRYGTEVQRFALPVQNFEVTREVFQNLALLYVGYSALGIALVFLVFSVVFYLILVAVAALLGLIARARLGGGRVWRSSAVAWGVGQLLNIIVGFIGLLGAGVSLTIFLVCIAFDLALLIKSKN